MNTLTIIGLCLLAPAIIILLGFSIIQIVQEVKKDPLTFLFVVVVISAGAGTILLLLSASY